MLVLFTHGSSGRLVVNPSAGRFQRPWPIPTPSRVAGGWGHDLIVPGSVQQHQRVESAVVKNPVRRALSTCGMWLSAKAVAETPAMGDVIRVTLREVLPAVAEALTPPRRRRRIRTRRVHG